MGNISTNVFIFFFSTLLLLIFILIIKNTSKYLKKAELEIQKLSGVIEQNPTSIVITDLSGNIQYVNSKFTENTGYTLKEIKGKNPSILKTGKSDTSLYEMEMNLLRTQSLLRFLIKRVIKLTTLP